MKTLYSTLLIFTFLSCKSQVTDKNQNQTNHSHQHTTSHHHKHTQQHIHQKSYSEYPPIIGDKIFNKYHNHSETHQTLNIELVNGKKFVSDTNTFIGINNTNNLLNNFDKDSIHTLKNYHDLGYKCKKEAVFILNNSKLEGDGFSTFHDLLHTLVFDIKNLGNSKTIIEAETHKQFIKEDVESFFKYFTSLN